MNYFLWYNGINEWYARDISRKIKTIRRISAEHGEYVNGHPPYGYIKNPERHNHLMPDVNTAPVVKRIFEMCVSGKGCTEIARTLKTEEISRPSSYHLDKEGVNKSDGNRMIMRVEVHYRFIGCIDKTLMIPKTKIRIKRAV